MWMAKKRNEEDKKGVVGGEVGWDGGGKVRWGGVGVGKWGEPRSAYTVSKDRQGGLF